MLKAAQRSAPSKSPQAYPVYATLISLLLCGLSVSAHGDYDFNNPNAVVVPASKPSQFDEYEERSRAREEAWEHDRAERERADEARQLLRDQQERERKQGAPYQQPSTDSFDNARPQYPQTFTYGSRPAPESSTPDRNYLKSYGVIIFIVLMISWFLRDMSASNLTRNPMSGYPISRQPRPTISSAAPPSHAATAPKLSVTDLNNDADKPIEFHPVQMPSTPPNSLNALAEQTLTAFASAQSRDPVAFASQLKKAQLDYSAASLNRVDLFLRQLRAQTQPDYNDYTTQPDHRKLLILLGFYIGTTIARVTQQNITWYDLVGAKQRLQNTTLPDSIQTLYSCMIGDRYHLLPIDLVCNMLFADTPSESSAAKLAFYQTQDHG